MWGVASSAISVNSQQQINLLHPASSFLAGHLNDTSLQHLPGLLGVRLIKRDRGADPVRSRWRLYRACRRWEKQRAAPNAEASWVKLCPGHRPPPSPISEITRRLWDLPWRSFVVCATSESGHESLPQGLPSERKIASWCHCCRCCCHEKLGRTSSASEAQEQEPLASPEEGNSHQNRHPRPITKDVPLPTAAFVVASHYYKVSHTQALLQITA